MSDGIAEGLTAERRVRLSSLGALPAEAQAPAARRSRSGVVTLDVGGKIFRTLRSTLAKLPAIDVAVELPDPKEDDTIFVDMDPSTFRKFLEIARGHGAELAPSLDAADNAPSSASARLHEVARGHGAELAPSLDAADNASSSASAGYWQPGSGKYPPGTWGALGAAITGHLGGATQIDPPVGDGNAYDFRLQKHDDAPQAKILKDGYQFTAEDLTTVLGYPAIPATGRTYWEVTVSRTSDGFVHDAIGVAEFEVDRSDLLGSDGRGWGLGGNGAGSNILINGEDLHRDVYPMLKDKETIGLDVDMDVGTLSFWVNGKLLGTPITGLQGRTLYPALTVYETIVLEIKTKLQPPQRL